jgi:tripartite-type tricarboxylate transporter receptor subunit TctC
VWAAPAHAASSFFEGKTIRIIVGSPAGGGFDLYSRTIARHLGRHIAGKPHVIVENMVGAGGVLAANHLYKVARPDGLTFGIFAGSHVFGQIVGQPGVEFDGRKFLWLGMPTRDVSVCVLTRASGITTVEAWRAAKTPVKIGATGALGSIDVVARVLPAVLGLPTQIVRGYGGTTDIRLAAESGEVAGGCWAWDAMRAVWGERLQTGDVTAVLQFSAKPLPDLPNVPLALGLARTDEARQMIEVVTTLSAISRTYVLPPGTPADRAQILRSAFAETMRDAEFLSEARRSKLPVDPVSAEELTRLVDEVFRLPQSVLANLKQIVK